MLSKQNKNCITCSMTACTTKITLVYLFCTFIANRLKWLRHGVLIWECTILAKMHFFSFFYQLPLSSYAQQHQRETEKNIKISLCINSAHNTIIHYSIVHTKRSCPKQKRKRRDNHAASGESMCPDSSKKCFATLIIWHALGFRSEFP